MSKFNNLSAAIRIGLFAGAASLFAAPTFAQDAADAAGEESETKLDTITVTGSRIRRVDAENASPVYIIDRETIERTSGTTIGDFLQETPAISGAATNPQVNNGGGTGAATVSLRGLGSARTLLLVNGRRFNAGDINAIPINMVQSVEVLKDGASAIYGSDAIGGVVNFILRSDIEGLEFSTQYGETSEGDGEISNFNMTGGASSERSSIVFGLDYNVTEQVSAADREFSRAPYALYSGEEIILGSSRAVPGRYVVPRSVLVAGGADLAACQGTSTTVAVTRRADRPGTSISDFRCFIGAGPNNDTYNFQADGNLVLLPQERYSIFGLGKSTISENVDYYYELMYNNTRSNFQIAPEPFDGRPAFSGVPLSAQSVYNPFGVNITDARLRLSAAGPRREFFETDNLQLNTGFRGYFDLGEKAWEYDIGLIYGRSTQRSERAGELYTPALAAALGPSFDSDPGAGFTPVCGTRGPDAANPLAGATLVSGCTPINFFGLNFDGLSDADRTAQNLALNALVPTLFTRNLGLLKMATANVSNSSLFELPAGDVGVAFGFEWRQESLDFQPDFLQIPNSSGNCLMSGGCQTPVAGDFSVREFYAEAFVPILADMTFAKSLNVTLGGRYSDYYDSFGDTSNFKIGLEWRPIDDVLFRGTYAEVFRAPTINNLFAPGAENAETYTDACNNYTGTSSIDFPGGAPFLSVACAGVPTNGNFFQSDSQANGLSGGNRDLQPEEGTVITYGIVYDASWLEGLSTTFDVWDVELEKGIGSANTTDIILGCARFGGPLCDLFTRDPSTGEVVSVDLRTVNFARIETDGFDLGARYKFPETDFGNFGISVDSTYIANYKVFGATLNSYAGDFRESSAGGDGFFGRWRAIGNVTWTMGPWSASWKQRYVHHVTETLQDGQVDLGDGIVDTRTVGAYTYHDIQAAYNWEALHTRISIGVDNVNDKQPPRLYSGFNATTDVRTYDTLGRAYYLRANVSF